MSSMAQVRLLLNAKADPFATQRNDWTPMLIAFKEGNLELGRYLQAASLPTPLTRHGLWCARSVETCDPSLEFHM